MGWVALGMDGWQTGQARGPAPTEVWVVWPGDRWYANRANTRFALTIVGWVALGRGVREEGSHIGSPYGWFG